MIPPGLEMITMQDFVKLATIQEDMTLGMNLSVDQQLNFITRLLN